MNRDHSAALLPSLALLACLLIGGCSFFQAQSQLRGNHVEAEQLKELTPGTSTRADVTALIGSPTARATSVPLMNAARAAWASSAPVVPPALLATARAPPSEPRIACVAASGTCRPTSAVEMWVW